MLKVKVLKKHIVNGLSCNSEDCPVALALRAKGCEYVTVNDDELSFEFQGENYSIVPPKRVETFINRFDDDINVKPFAFNLPV